MGRMMYLIIAIIAVGIMLVTAKQGAKHTDHTADRQYPCTPVCTPVTKEMERAFGKTDDEIVNDLVDFLSSKN